MLTGSNLVHTREYNLRIVHEVIRLYGPVSRAEIARRTALTGQTVSNLVKDLVDLGLVQEGERQRDGGRGAPSTALVVNPDGCYSVGLDLGREHLTGVLVDLAGTVRQRESLALDVPTPAEALDLMAGTVRTLVARQGLRLEQVCGVGIGIPGPMQRADGGGYVVSADAFPGWHGVPIADRLRERLGLSVVLENSATAAAVGERWYGEGRRIGTFFYLFLGTGLGGALVVNGRPYVGHTGNAGEVGYLPATPSDVHGGGDRTHVGQHFSLPCLYAGLRAAGADARTPEDLDRLLADGHPGLLAWLDVAADHLTGVALAVEYVADPEAIVFGGRLPTRLLERLAAGVARRLPERRAAGKGAPPRLLLATAGADAAALGVATVPVYEYFAPAPQVLLKERAERSGDRLLMRRAAAR